MEKEFEEIALKYPLINKNRHLFEFKFIYDNLSIYY